MNSQQTREIRAQVDRIASSALFAESERLRRFLRFTTEAALSGEAAALKEYVVGRKVFDRDSEYDPRLDPIVRVEARRLRSKLTQYYDGAGRAENIRIDYPKGGYAPVFRPADARFKRTRTAWVGVGAALCALVFPGAAGRQPQLAAVLPAQWVYSDHTDTDPLAIPLSEALTIDLANGHAVPVLAWPVVAQKPQPGRPLRELASNLGASRMVIVIARNVDGLDLVTVFDVDPRTGRKIRALQYRTPIISFAEREHLAQRMARDLARQPSH